MTDTGDMTSTQASIIQKIREQTVSPLRGSVLEIGAGNGENFPYLSKSVVLTALEPDAKRCRKLAERGRIQGIPTTILQGKCENIPMPDNSVDAVISTFALCSVDDPERAMSEIMRALRPGCAVHFVEHIAAPQRTFIHALQRLLAPMSRRFNHGCDPLADTQRHFITAGFSLEDLQRREFSGIPMISGRAVCPK